jgi:hypothetical protein
VLEPTYQPASYAIFWTIAWGASLGCWPRETEEKDNRAMKRAGGVNLLRWIIKHIFIPKETARFATCHFLS